MRNLPIRQYPVAETRVPVTEELTRRLVSAQVPQRADLSVEPLANGGWDNWTFRLGTALVVRLPSASEYAQAVEKEHRWLPTLAPQLPSHIPALRTYDKAPSAALEELAGLVDVELAREIWTKALNAPRQRRGPLVPRGRRRGESLAQRRARASRGSR